MTCRRIERAIRYARYTLQQHRNGECRRSLNEAKAAIDDLLAVIPHSPEPEHAPVAGPSSETQYGSQKRKTGAGTDLGQRIEKALKFNGYEPPARIRHSSTSDITLTLPNTNMQSLPEAQPDSPVRQNFAATPVYQNAPPPQSPLHAAFPQHFTPAGSVKYRAILPQDAPQSYAAQSAQSFSQAIAQMSQSQPHFEPEEVKPVVLVEESLSPASSASPSTSTTMHSTLSAATLGPNDMPPELRQTIDEIFFSFLDGVCSNRAFVFPRRLR